MTTAAPARPRLEIRALFGEMLRVYRAHWGWLLLASLIVFLPLAVIDAVVEKIRHDGVVGDGLLGALTTVEHMFGDVLFNGLVAAAVIAWRTSSARPGIIAVARTLPWPTIIALELLLPITTGVLLLALIVPGLVFATYVTLAPAVVKVEHLRAWPAVKRSFQLVRGNFWRVLLVLVLLVGVAAIAEEVLQDLTSRFVGHVVVKVVIEMIFSPFSAVAIVLMVFHLRAPGPDGE